jgi:hypothetical protein
MSDIVSPIVQFSRGDPGFLAYLIMDSTLFSFGNLASLADITMGIVSSTAPEWYSTIFAGKDTGLKDDMSNNTDVEVVDMI